ncbi:MAG: molybdopterin-dependent oxidoreductase [Alphaproteobacteria bacterium]|nr:molybdopterin-dependent oxidoreductase [Alphaproteobacteria bacterium]
MDKGWTKTTCPYCGVGCGVLARPKADGTTEVKGDLEHPANYGRLCSKGSALGETMSLDDRLLDPMVDGRTATWDAALDLVADKFRDSIEKHGPDSVALYVSGQILTEDYYVANKLMKGYIGTANIDTNSRLCMASSVAGHKRAFGSDTVPGAYEDLELADLVVLVGSNLAWCHPVLYQRLVAARKTGGTKVVVIDPRRTATCEIADLHLAIAPGADVALFNGLLAHLTSRGKIDQHYIQEYTSGFGDAVKSANSLSMEKISEVCGLREADIRQFYELFEATEKSVSVYSQGVNQSTAGTDKVNAIVNCHLATGRIGRPGMGPFSVTGQPNAMGGREVGGLANMLAGHMELGNETHRRIVQDFWGSPGIADAPGLKAVDLFEAVADGRIKAVWIMATNPVDSLPDADKVRAALKDCPFVVVSDVTRHTDTTQVADVLLPATAWGEKDGTVTNSERCISRQRSFLPPPGEARPDWWQLSEVGKRLGYREAFSYSGPREVFAEYAAMTGEENHGNRDLDISAYANVSDDDYKDLAPFYWPQRHGRGRGVTRFFAEGQFYTSDRRGRFVETPFRAPSSRVSSDFPLVLNTGRIRDQWHTMTRSAKAPRLTAHYAEPFLEIHPIDAEKYGLEPESIAKVTSQNATVLLRVAISDSQRPGSVFAPMHWTDQYASLARIDSLIASHTDPVSGQPESKFTPVAVEPYAARWFAFAISVAKPELPSSGYHACAPIKAGYRVEIAGVEQIDDWQDFADQLFALGSENDEVLTYRDEKSGQFRFAHIKDGHLAAALYVSKTPVSASRNWVANLLGAKLEPPERLRLLAGRPGEDMPDPGAIVCSCFEVGVNQIVDAIMKQGCTSVDDVGACVKAGTNCGSCRAEIGKLIDEKSVSKAG